ncbi:DUF5336 domain-containing protein [Rhodococcus daqingensis]|uniref:DUF5336 domain-containing protein n=1 Tax=Rhodococcus daqingensis TaxID=2479363 RepID=A0ABW2RTV0_9NOCA
MSNAPFAAPAAGPPVTAVGRPNALGIAVLTLGLLNLLLGFGPYFVRSSGDEINVSGFLLPQGLLVVVFLLFSGISAGLSTVARLSQFPGAAPVLRAIATAAAAVGALLALFLLIAISNVPTLTGDFIGDSDDDLSLGVSLGWGGIAILALAILQTLLAFAALAYDLGLVQPRGARTPDPTGVLPPGPAEGFASEAPEPTATTVGSPAPTKPYTQALALDPYTPMQTLGHIAQSDPALRPYVAANPSAYPDLLDWLAELDDPEVDAALKARPDRAEAKTGNKAADGAADKDMTGNTAKQSADKATAKDAEKVEAP